MGGEQDVTHLVRRKNLDLFLRFLERVALLRCRLAVWMEVSLLLGETEHGDEVAPDAVLADRPEFLESVEEPVDVSHGDLRDVARHGVGEPLEAAGRVPNIDVTHALAFQRDHELGGHLDVGPNSEEVGPVRLIEPDGIGQRDFTRSLPCAGPFVHRGGKTDSVLPSHLLAVAEQVDVAAGRFIGGRPAIGQSDADLLGDHPSFVHGREAAGLAPASLLPCQRELGVSVPTVHRVDLDSRGTVADFHDTAATFAFPGHRPRLSSQLVRKTVRKICPGLL